MTMILMYLSIKTLQESAIEDDGLKNKCNHVLGYFFSPMIYVELVHNVIKRDEKKRGIHPNFYNK